MGHSPNSSITTMWHNSGFILTGSKDNTVRVHTTTRPPHLINSLSSSNGAVTSVTYIKIYHINEIGMFCKISVKNLNYQKVHFNH